jgi:site-specific DNA recombinase
MGHDAAQRRPVLDIYARLSKTINGETIQVEDQVEMCVEKLEERGADVGEVHKDNSLSAWNPKVVRKQWETLMRRLESGACDGVIVYDLSRFSRKVIEGERLVELAAKGLRVWAWSGEYDLTTADGRRHFREAMVAAAGESDKISERVRRGKLRKARRGKPAGGTRGYASPGWLPTPPGWEPGDPRESVSAEQLAAERKIVRECYEHLLAGGELGRLVVDLNARGVGTATGGRWYRASLSLTLRRAALAGLREHNGEVVGVLPGVEPVVSREDWERLRGVFDGRKVGRPSGRVHWASGLLACGRCGQPLGGTARPHYTPYEDGAVRREYRCRNDPDHDGCGNNYIDARRAEEIVAEAVKARLGDPRRAERVAAKLQQNQAVRAKMTAEISVLEQSADELATKVATWGVDRVDKSMAPILRRLAELQAQLPELDAVEDEQSAAQDAARSWDEAAERGDMATMRAMIRRAFPRLTVIPGERDDASRFDWDGKTLPTRAR